MANSNLSKSKQKEIKELIEIGRKQGYLTVSALNDLLPNNLFDSLGNLVSYGQFKFIEK